MKRRLTIRQRIVKSLSKRYKTADKGAIGLLADDFLERARYLQRQGFKVTFP